MNSKKKRTSNAHLHHLPWLNTHIPTIHTIAIHTIPAMPFCAWDESGVSSCWWCAPSQNHRHREALDLVENGYSYWSFNVFKKNTINSLALLSNWMVEVDWTVAISWFILHPLPLNNASDCPTTKRTHSRFARSLPPFFHTLQSWSQRSPKPRSEMCVACSLPPGFAETCRSVSSFSGCWAMWLLPGFGWTIGQTANFQGCRERSLGPSCSRSDHQKTDSEGCLERSPLPGTGWTLHQKSSFEDWLARSPAEGTGWTYSQKLNFED